MTSFVLTSWDALLDSARALVIPALIFAAIAFAARGVESLRTARAATPEVRTNLALFTFDIVAVTPLLVLALGAVSALMQQNGIRLIAPDTWSALPLWLVTLIAVFIGDFVGYWRHRLEHTPLLWPAHAIHHSDAAMTWTTGVRFHPLNRLTTSLIDTTALALLGFPPEAIMLNAYIRHYYGLFIHMDLPWTYGPLGRVFVSPAMHRWHHIRDADGAGANFATVFSVFDQAFRTHHTPGPCTAPLGVRDAIGRDPVSQLLWPLRVLVHAVTRHPGARAARAQDPGATNTAL
ncbi:sterol desaturase family protein [Terricaulis silvestris]|uniref:Fatty acid hydroxylase superfamily protein n=1 Tax=Terricaulis silvestris TaxID=2686094 RepID=A0A6I6MJJ1_9CAUL|nr:sterol desaturase family protein [Terricaulis silvestris]QGZ93298.1 Fatty acid hydroxylase superfamily protein [Terricaulis silvestris]